jgi:hypothetical protein
MSLSQREIIELILSRYIILFGGRYSRGKSLSITALNFYSAMFNNRKKFLTNMPIDLKGFGNTIEYIPLISTKQFDDIPQSTNIIWDETYVDLFSRSASSIKNKYISLFSRDVAKMDAKIIGSVQFFDTIDKILGMILEIIIIPEYLNKYSENTKKDNEIRFAKKDFMMKWTIYDRREQNEYELILNLYEFIFMYNTKFKPQPLFINHDEYIKKLKKNEKMLFEDIKEKEVEFRLEHYKKGFEDLGKVNIR